MSTFVHSPLLWGLLAVSVPILIHLINIFRQRHVDWAAMEFLLRSQRKTRKWILLKQFLLLACRMTAIAAAVLMFAQPILRSEWGSVLGGGRTHHLVLLDDSYSMTDRWAGATAFDRGKQAIVQLVREISRQGSDHTFTLMRFSEAPGLGQGTQPELFKEQLGQNAEDRFSSILQNWQATELAVGPALSLETAAKLTEDSGDETNLVYLVTDLRSRDWRQSEEIREFLQRMQSQGSRLTIIRSAGRWRPNLTISGLAPSSGIRAVSVPLPIEVQITNYGEAAATNVPVQIEEDGDARPALMIERIEPGESVRRTFFSRFATAGEHTISASLAEDHVAADNRRFSLFEVASTLKVLLVDGDPQLDDTVYLTNALSPGGAAKTGLTPIVESPRFLRTANLDEFATICLLNISHLEPAERDRLEGYVRAGGGVLFFVGDQVNPTLFNELLYRDGEGLFPVELSGPRDLLVDRRQMLADIEFSDHPAVRTLTKNAGPLLQTVFIDRYFGIVEDSFSDDDDSVRLVASFRSQAPAMVEKPFGAGRVVAVLTTAGPRWNNWAKDNPSFVVAMLELQAYLAQRPDANRTRTVGSPLVISLDPFQYDRRITIDTPQSSPTARTAVSAEVTPDGMEATWNDTGSSGFYRVEKLRKDSNLEHEGFAFNVDPREGNLAVFDDEDLAGALQGIHYQLWDADELSYRDLEIAGLNLAPLLFYVLISLLLAEQVLAYVASYHPRASKLKSR